MRTALIVFATTLVPGIASGQPARQEPPAALARNAAADFNEAKLQTKLDPTKAVGLWIEFFKNHPKSTLISYAHLNYALCLYHTNKFAEAAKSAQAAADAPDFTPRPKALLLLGKAKRELSRAKPTDPVMAEALAAFLEAEKEAAEPFEKGGKPRDPETVVEAGYSAAEAFALQGKFAESEQKLKVWFERNANHTLAAGARLLRATTALNAGNNKGAEREADAFLTEYSTDPRHVEAMFYRGLARSRIGGKDDDATKDLDAAGETDHPLQAAACFEAGTVYERVKNLQKAAAAYRKVSASRGGEALAVDALCRLAGILEAKEWQKAIDVLKEARQKNPTPAQDEVICYRLVLLYWKNKQFAEATRVAEEQLRKYPTGARRHDAALVAAYCYEQAKNNDTAYKMWGEVGTSTDATFRLAAALGQGHAALALDKPDVAVKHFGDAINSKAEAARKAEAFLGRGTARMKQKNTPAAKADFDKAVADGARSVASEALYKLAEIELESGKLDEAASLFVKCAAREDPVWAPSALLRAGQAYEDAGKHPDAIKYYKLVIQTYPDSPQATVARQRLMALKAQ